MTQIEQENKKGMLEEYYQAEAEKMKGQPWYIRHKSSLIIGGLFLASCIFCVTWSYFFPDGIM